jgi:hypothetical protein
MNTITPIATLAEYLGSSQQRNPLVVVVMAVLAILLIGAMRIAGKAAAEFFRIAVGAAGTGFVIVLIPIVLLAMIVMYLI